jgi:HAE1 family hydrophobic/amphiphilic exporter-1
LRLTEICVKRPVFAFMLILFLVVLGVSSFLKLGVDLFPRSDPASVFVKVRLPGATPEEVTTQVVMPLEEAIAAVSGIDELRAMVSEGSATVYATFVLERDIGEAAEDVREKVSGAMRNLPPNVLPPVVQKSDPDLDPVVTLAISGQRSTRELTEIADKQVRRALETVDGVAGVDVNGGRNRQINLFLDLDKMGAYKLTAQDVERAVRTENIEAPGGRIVRGPTEVGVRTMGRVTDVEQFNDIIIKNDQGAPIRVSDVGRVEDGVAEQRTFAYYGQKAAVVLEVRRQTGTNTVQVVDTIKKRLAGMANELPAGVKVDIVKDQSIYIRNSVASLEEHLVLGSLLASLIVWLFIRDWRTVLISSIAIPTSIITTFSLMKALDFTLNSMTLLGLTLAVGIVIDDAIIVLENIYRFIEERGMPPIEAAVRATQEIATAVIATTVSLVIIFVPIAFMSGYARRLVNQFGWTMAMSIMVSMLVAFTLTPSLSARLLRRKPAKEGGRPRSHEPKHGFIEKVYVSTLEWSLRHRWVIVLICFATLGSTYWVNGHIGRDWMPQEDQSELSVYMELPEGSSIEATEKLSLPLAAKFQQIPGVVGVLPQTSSMSARVNNAFITVLLDEPERRADLNTIAAQVREILKDYAYTRPRINFPNALGGRESMSPIRGMLLGPDLKKLADMSKLIGAEMYKLESVVDTRVALNLNNPEMQVTIDRARASDLGVRVSDIAGAVRLLMSGEDQISTFKEGPEQYPVTMRLLPGQRDDPAALSRLLIPSSRLGLIRLDSVAHLERGLGPGRIDRFNRQFSVGVYGNVAPGHSLQEAAIDTQGVVSKIGLPAGYQLKFSGQVKILEETTTNMLMALALASIFMYMVLAAQFESLIHPFIIMLTLPLSIPFALLSLIATGRSLNLFSALGVLLLLGIVKKNGILQIDYMNHLREAGNDLHYSIIEANRVRLRPILMTTFAIIAGLLPTAFGTGSGASQRSAIAVTIIGGQLLCLILSLLVVPVGYSFVEGARERIAHRKLVPSPASGD